MIFLTSTSDKITVTAAASMTVDTDASYMDMTASNGATTPGKSSSNISGTSGDVVAAPSSGTRRAVKTLSIRNKHATDSVTITVGHTDGTTAVAIFKAALAAGEAVVYNSADGFMVVSNDMSIR